MSNSRRNSWSVAAILGMTVLLTATLGAQKSESPEVLYERAVQKDQVDGDVKAAIDLYKQVVAVPGVTSATKAKAQARLSSLTVPAESADRRICTGCGGDYAPISISEDGRMMAFGPATGRRGLFVRDIASGQVTQILSDPVLSPVLSRDLRQIVYVSYGGRPYELRIIANKEGAEPRVLNSNPEFNILIPAAWARDGKSVLVVAHMKLDQTWSIGWISVSDGSFKPLKSLGWRFQCCGPIGLPSLSRDGRFIAYAAKVLDIAPTEVRPTDSNDTHIFVLAADGSTPAIELVKGASINEGPVWTPDGKNLLFVSNRGDSSFGLWSVSVPNGALKEVKRGTGEIHSFGMTDSGSYVYSPPQTAITRFAVSELANVTRPRDTPSPEVIRGTRPVWSPDGKRIAFHRWKRDSIFDPKLPGDTALLVYSVDTKEEKRYVPNTGVAAVEPVWSGNGNFLFQIMWNSNNKRSLHRLDLKTGEFKEIHSAVDSQPENVSYDGNTIYQLEPAEATAAGTCPMNRIVAIEIVSGQRRTVATLPDSEDMIFAPDGKTLYLEPCDEIVNVRQFFPDSQIASEPVPHRIVAVDLLTGGQREVFAVKPPAMLRADLRLSPDGRSLVEVIEPSFPYYYSKFTQNESAQLIRVAVTGNDAQELFRFSGARLRSPSWSADGTAVTVRAGTSENGGWRRIPLNGGAVELVQQPLPTGSLSPDGLHTIVVETVPPLGEIRAIDEVLSKTRQ